MAPEVSGGSRNCRNVLKKGPWTAAEDLLLQEYVKKHGEGNWNAVQRNSGLMRCGKSCRLRWANHLRPNLKKGAFSPEEEQLIVDLHAQLGNKWARMAAQIPGRTDNEIKNYWNTRLKRRQRAGLPIYTNEIPEQRQRISSSRTHSLSSLFASPLHQNPNPFKFDPSLTSPADTPYANHQLKPYPVDDGRLALSLDSSNSMFSFFNHGVANQSPIDSLVQYSSSLDLDAGMEALGLPSIQPAAADSSDGVEDFEVEPRKKSGLLEDLFGETQTLACSGKENEQFVEAADFGFSYGGSSSHDSYQGVETKAAEEGIASMDDELMNLLDNFPLSVPIPDWDGGDGSESPVSNNGTSSAMLGQPVAASEYNPVASSTGAPNQDWNSGSFLWNILPTIY